MAIAARSNIGRMEMDRGFEEREAISRGVVMALNKASTNCGVKVLRDEIKALTLPKDILQAIDRWRNGHGEIVDSRARR